jgi:RNA polymerase sigma-70 factor (ECF subfamily)
MNPAELDERLSRISTMWTIHLQAHREGVAALQAELLRRYRGPAFRYLIACVHDADVAEDLAQEFALRFLRGDFGKADRSRGRFRDYLRVSLSRLATDYYRQQAKQGVELAADPTDRRPPESADREYDEHWRDELLNRAWSAMAKESPTEYAALKLRVEVPDMNSVEMATKLSEQLGRQVSSDSVRKAIERGRKRFAETLLDEVAATLDDADDASLEAELTDLGLIRYCRSVLERRRDEAK